MQALFLWLFAYQTPFKHQTAYLSNFILYYFKAQIKENDSLKQFMQPLRYKEKNTKDHWLHLILDLSIS